MSNDKNAKLTLTLKADSGYTSKEIHRISQNQWVKILQVVNETEKDRFMQGYVCALATLLKMEGYVSTEIRELFSAGIGNMNLKQLKEAGTDEHDIQVLSEHWSNLSKN